MMSEEPDYFLDIQELGGEKNAPPPRTDDRDPDSPSAPDSDKPLSERRPWVGVLFECCGVYQRIYRNQDKTAYVGHCPRCRRQVRFRIHPGGTSSRFFIAY